MPDQPYPFVVNLIRLEPLAVNRQLVLSSAGRYVRSQIIQTDYTHFMGVFDIMVNSPDGEEEFMFRGGVDRLAAPRTCQVFVKTRQGRGWQNLRIRPEADENGVQFTVWRAQHEDWQRVFGREARYVLGYNAFEDEREEPDTMPAATATYEELTANQLSHVQTATIRTTLGTTWSTVQWMNDHAATVLFVCENSARNRFYTDMLAALRRWGCLTERQYEAVCNDRRNGFNSASSTNSASDAGPLDVAYLPNGKYSIEYGGEHITIQIYTVQRGPLANKRIVKRLMGDGRFKGYAFLRTDCSMKIWNSQRDQVAGTAFDTFVTAMLEHARTSSVSGEPVFAHGQATSWRTSTGNQFTVWQSSICRRCNRELTSPQSVQDGIGPECSGRNVGQDRTVAASIRETTRPRPTTSGRGTRVGAQHLAEQQPARTSLDSPLLSELGTGEIR